MRSKHHHSHPSIKNSHSLEQAEDNNTGTQPNTPDMSKASNSSEETSSSHNNVRPVISDGKVMRQIWRPEDGSGDPDTTTFEKSRYTDTGHPTWKIYCGDAPERVNGIFVEPPKFCYLDDRAAFKILHWEGFSKAERGRFWKHDFGSKGDLRPNRKTRGRPAFIVGGDVAFVPGPSKKYRFQGAFAPRDLTVINEELAAQKAGVALIPVDPDLPQQRVQGRAVALKKSSEVDRDLPGPEHLSTSGRKRSVSPVATQLPSATAKRARHIADTMLVMDAQPMGSPKPMPPQVPAPKDSEKSPSGSVIAPQQANYDLQIQASSLNALQNDESTELSAFRVSKRLLRESLESKSNGAALEALVVALRKEAMAYRTLATHVFHRFKSTNDIISRHSITYNNNSEDAEHQSDGILAARDGESVIPLAVVTKVLDAELSEIRQDMKQVLGEGWEHGEEETQVLLSER